MRAERAAREANIPALWAEVDSALRVLNTLAARRIAKAKTRRSSSKASKRCSSPGHSWWTPAGSPSGVMAP